MRPAQPSAPGSAERSRGRVALAWALLAVWTAIVWGFGTSRFGSAETSRFLAPLLEWLLAGASREQVFAAAAVVRKLAHPIEYGVLAWLALRALWLSGLARPIAAGAGALGFAVVVAGLDEWRQSRLPSRTGSRIDVALDTAGAAGAIAVGMARRRRRSAPQRPGEGPSV